MKDHPRKAQVNDEFCKYYKFPGKAQVNLVKFYMIPKMGGCCEATAK